MVPILAQSINEQFENENSLQEYILELCKEHKSTGRALAFALLVYDFKDNTIQDILDKTSYWTALDSISGKFLSIFYVDSNDQYNKRRQEEIYQDEIRKRNRSTRDDAMSFVVPIFPKATPLDKSVELLKSKFGVEERVKTPFVLFFQTDDNDLTDYLLVELKEEKIEEAFIELKTFITAAVDALKLIDEKYKKNGSDVFRELQQSVEHSQFIRFVNFKVKPFLTVGNLIALIKILGGAF